MKALNPILIAVLAVTISACSSSNKLSRSGESYDDVYYSSDDDYAQRDDGASYGAGDAQNTSSNELPVQSTSRTEGDGNTYVTNNYYNEDDYYDYAYASRIRRFHTNVSLSYGYYDGWYTNTYFYNLGVISSFKKRSNERL